MKPVPAGQDISCRSAEDLPAFYQVVCAAEEDFQKTESS